MAVLMLGGLPFDVLHVVGMSEDESWTYASHETVQGLPVLQLIDRDATGVTLAVRLHHSFGDMAATRKQLRAFADAGEVLPLQTGEGELLGWFVLEQIRSRWAWTTPTGQDLSREVTLTLTEHRAPDAILGSFLAVAGSEGPDRTDPTLPDVTRDPSEVPLSEIVRTG